MNNDVIGKIMRELADEGKIVEGGWRAYVISLGLDRAPRIQQTEMRKAFMLGAQHLFSALMEIMDPDTEVTEQDMDRMELISKELEEFRRSLLS